MNSARRARSLNPRRAKAFGVLGVLSELSEERAKFRAAPVLKTRRACLRNSSELSEERAEFEKLAKVQKLAKLRKFRSWPRSQSSPNFQSSPSSRPSRVFHSCQPLTSFLPRTSAAAFEGS